MKIEIIQGRVLFVGYRTGTGMDKYSNKNPFFISSKITNITKKTKTYAV